jgi:hypothetical protein
MYILGEAPKGTSEAFNALEDVFGAEEFSSADAAETIANVLEIGPDAAMGEFTRLLRAGHIVEA